MESLELLNDQYGHCGECHEVHYIPDMVAIDGYYYCKSCSRPTPLALDGGESAPFQAESTPEVLSTLQGESTPAHRK